jgi:hypothetical protein
MNTMLTTSAGETSKCGVSGETRRENARKAHDIVITQLIVDEAYPRGADNP